MQEDCKKMLTWLPTWMLTWLKLTLIGSALIGVAPASAQTN